MRTYNKMRMRPCNKMRMRPYNKMRMRPYNKMRMRPYKSRIKTNNELTICRLTTKTLVITIIINY